MKAIYSPSHKGGILLKKLKRWPSLSAKFSGQFVRVWSGEWDAWWRPNGHGYTANEKEAGVFVFEKALAASHHAGPEKRIEYVPLPTFGGEL